MRRSGANRHEVGGHQAAGALFRPARQLLDLFGRFRVDLLERLEQRRGEVGRQDAEEVGAVVGAHLGRDARGRIRPHQPRELTLARFVEALEDLRGVVGRAAE